MIRMIQRLRSGTSHENFPSNYIRMYPSESQCVRAQCSRIARELTYNSAYTHVTARFVISRLVEPYSHRRRAYNNSSAVVRPHGRQSLFQSAGQVGDLSCPSSPGAYLIIRSIMSKLLIKRFLPAFVANSIGNSVFNGVSCTTRVKLRVIVNNCHLFSFNYIT